MAELSEVAVDIAIGSAGTVSDVIEVAAAAAIPFTQFLPLIRDVSEILDRVTDLYRTAQHNKNITKLLMERISAANTTVNILRAREDLCTTLYYKSLQRLVQVLHNMRKYIEEITQYNTAYKFLGAKNIEKRFKDLCKEYDSSITSLSFHLTVDFKFNEKEEDKILKEDVSELLKFQAALVESMNDVKQEVSHTNDRMNLVVERVSEIAITMQNLIDDNKKVNSQQIQSKIDNVFRESLLPFDDYEESTFRTERLRKYVHIRTKDEFAFKTVNNEHINEVKNQVTILKKLKDCQNIINFYGLTTDGNKKTYLVTEWAENKNLREYIADRGSTIETKLKMRIAYDIAKGLNFLNCVKMVHRDIRSENIVITSYDVAKITNFSLSRRTTDDTIVIGIDKERVRYSAPEIIRRAITGEKENEKSNRAKNMIKYDTKCEVYSFGILLWEIAECKLPYEQFGDFLEIAKKVVGGYREKFTPDTDIPEKYQDLVNCSVDNNPGFRPIFSKVLTDLRDIFKTFSSKPPSSPRSKRPSPITPPVRKMTYNTIAAAEEDCAIDWDSFDYMTIDKAIEVHKNDSKDKKKLYKCFDTYANMDNPRAKYWKAYYIQKGWSDLNDRPEEEKQKLSAQLFKAAADYGDEMPDAQLRYATMVMHGKGVRQNTNEAITYFAKAAKNDHVVAMFNIATYYFSNDQAELGNYYMIKAASKNYDQAIRYCNKNHIAYS